VADALRKEPGVEVEVVRGKPGELTVQVNGKTLAKRVFFLKPSVEKVLKAVRGAGELSRGTVTWQLMDFGLRALAAGAEQVFS